jgi:DNA polymerase-3 subunit beta
MIRKLPDSEVTIYVDENDRIEISCEKAVFHIPGRNGEEFPYLPEIAKDHYVVMSQFTLREMIQQTIFSISASSAIPYQHTQSAAFAPSA